MKFGIVLSAAFASSLAVAAPTILETWVIPTHSVSRFEPISQEHNRPIVVGDLLYYATNQGEVVALPRAGGRALWRTKVGSPIHGAFTYGRSKLFVGDTGGTLTALNAHDGSTNWIKKIQAEWLSPPTVLRDKVCASTSAEEIYCFSEKDGKELWHYAHRGDEKMTIRGTSSPTLHGDAVYQGFADGHIAALSQESGQVLWTRKLRVRTRFYDVDMPVYVDDSGIIVSAYDGNTYLLDRTTGATQWTFPVGSHSGFLVEADRFYFSGLNGYIYGMDRSTGTPLWKTAIESGVGLTPARVNDMIVVATTADPIYVLKDRTGQIAWTRSLGAGTYAAVASSPAEGAFYALSNYGNLFSFQVTHEQTCYEPFDSISLPSIFWPHSESQACRT